VVGLEPQLAERALAAPVRATPGCLQAQVWERALQLLAQGAVALRRAAELGDHVA
jgi:hypothetical protein